MSGLNDKKSASSSKVQNREPKKETANEFKLPTWKKIIGDVHITSNWDMQYDLMAIEEYMNNMIASGWKPVSISGGTKLSFVACEPGEYVCRTILTLGENGSFNKSKAAELSELLINDGAVIVPQEKTLGAQIGLIALRASSLGPFEITSDLDSRIAEYEARKKYAESMGILFLVVASAQIAIFERMQGMGGGIAFGVVWLALALYYLQPVLRYKKILKRLRHERDVSAM